MINTTLLIQPLSPAGRSDVMPLLRSAVFIHNFSAEFPEWDFISAEHNKLAAIYLVPFVL